MHLVEQEEKRKDFKCLKCYRKTNRRPRRQGSQENQNEPYVTWYYRIASTCGTVGLTLCSPCRFNFIQEIRVVFFNVCQIKFEFDPFDL